MRSCDGALSHERLCCIPGSAEITHLRGKIKTLEVGHAATLECAEEQIEQADEDLQNSYQNHAKLKKDYERVQTDVRRHQATIADIYADPNHEAHGSKHKGGDVALRSALQHANLERIEMTVEINRLVTEIAEATSAAAANSDTATIDELHEVIETLREDFLASTTINQRLGLEMESLREQANRIKDRNDELEYQLQAKAIRRRNSGQLDEMGTTLAAEMGALNQSYDQSTRTELEATVRSASKFARQQPMERRGSMSKELKNCRATIARLTSEKAMLENQLAAAGMSDEELRKFRSLNAELQAAALERQQVQHELDHKQRENAALRFMYKDLKRTAVDSRKHADLREGYDRLSRTYSQAKGYAGELETVNSALQFQLDAMALQIEHTMLVSHTPSRHMSDTSQPTAAARVSKRVTDDSASDATLETVVHNMQLRLDGNQTNLELQRWKVQSAESDVADLTEASNELRRKLAASENARLVAVGLLDKQTDPQEVLRKQGQQTNRGAQRRITELELELTVVNQREVARREETKRIHADALVTAAARIQELEERDSRASRLGQTPQSSPRHRRSRRSGAGMSSDGDVSTAISTTTGADRANRRRSKDGRHRLSSGGAASDGASPIGGKRKDSLAVSSRARRSSKDSKMTSLSALDKLLQSSSIRPKRHPKREDESSKPPN